MTALQLVDEVRTMTDAEQWLIVAAVALLVVAFTGYVGLAVVLVGRTIVSIGRRAAAWRRSARHAYPHRVSPDTARKVLDTAA